MAVRQQQRRGTAAQWTSANPILSAAEIGFEIDTNKFKIGDGINRWDDLTYFTADAAQAIQDLIDGAPGVLDTLNELAASLGDNPDFIGTLTSDLALKAPINAPTFTGTVSGITKTMVGLGNVDNTSDANKPVSTATQTALDAKASNTALQNHENDTTSIHGIADTAELATKTYADDAVDAAVAALTKSSVGLSNVDNTSDADKPISDATADALDLKAPIDSPTFTGTVAGITKSMVGLANVDNTSDANKPVSTAQASAIATAKSEAITAAEGYTDTAISNLVDGAPTALNTLNELAAALGDDSSYASSITTALGLKAPLASPALTGNPTAPTQTLGDDSTKIATTAFVKAAIEDIASLDLVLDGGGV